MKSFPSESVLFARAALPKYLAHKSKTERKNRFAWAKDYPGVTVAERHRLRVFSSRELKYSVVEGESWDSRLCRWADEAQYDFNVTCGVLAADANTKTLALDLGPRTAPFLYALLKYLQIPTALIRRVSHVVTETPGAKISEGVLYQSKGVVKVSYDFILSLHHFPKFRAKLLALDLKNITAHMHKPGFLLGFHIGDGSVSKIGSNLQVTQRVAAAHAEEFARRTGMSTPKKIVKCPKLWISGEKALTYLDSLYAGYVVGMPILAEKYRRYQWHKKKLTKRIKKRLESPKNRVEPGAVSASEKHDNASSH